MCFSSTHNFLNISCVVIQSLRSLKSAKHGARAVKSLKCCARSCCEEQKIHWKGTCIQLKNKFADFAKILPNSKIVFTFLLYDALFKIVRSNRFAKTRTCINQVGAPLFWIFDCFRWFIINSRPQSKLSESYCNPINKALNNSWICKFLLE